MQKILALFLILILSTSIALAGLRCSANGTQLIYINGINVDSDTKTKKTASRIDGLISNRASIDTQGVVPLTEPVYNTSRQAVADIQKLQAELATNAPNGTSKEQYWLGLVATDLNLQQQIAESPNVVTDQVKSKALLRSKKALDYILSKKNLKNSIDNKTFMNSAFYKSIEGYNQRAAEIIANAATEVDTLVKLKTTIDKYFRQKKKVIVVSHSQGNEALRSSLAQYRSELVGDDKINFEKYFGTLQIAPPSPILATACSTASTDSSPACHSRFVKLNNDLIVFGSKTILSGNDPISPNYIYNNSASNASGYRDVFIIGPVIEYFHNLGAGYAFHSMDETYLNNAIYANNVENNELLSMTTIFNNRLVEVSETLEDNCSLPNIQLSSIEVVPPIAGSSDWIIKDTYNNSGFIHFSVQDLNDADAIKTTRFFWSTLDADAMVANGTSSGPIFTPEIEYNLSDSVALAAPDLRLGYQQIQVRSVNKFLKETTTTIQIVFPKLYPNIDLLITAPITFSTLSNNDIIGTAAVKVVDRNDIDGTTKFKIISNYFNIPVVTENQIVPLSYPFSFYNNPSYNTYYDRWIVVEATNKYGRTESMSWHLGDLYSGMDPLMTFVPYNLPYFH